VVGSKNYHASNEMLDYANSAVISRAENNIIFILAPNRHYTRKEELN
jgi:hypothetical protein